MMVVSSGLPCHLLGSCLTCRLWSCLMGGTICRWTWFGFFRGFGWFISWGWGRRRCFWARFRPVFFSCWLSQLGCGCIAVVFIWGWGGGGIFIYKEKLPKLGNQFPSLMQLNLRNLSRLPGLNSLKHYPLMRRHVLYIDILRPREINLKIDILEILNI